MTYCRTIAIAACWALLSYSATRVATPPAALTGTIVASPSQEPVIGAVLHGGNPTDGSIYTAAPIGADGAFALDRLPAGVYELAVEVGGGLYLVEKPLRLEPGEARSVHLALGPQARGAVSSPALAKKKKMSFWDNPLTVTLVVLGSATVVGLIVEELDDDDETVSPSQP